MSEVSLPKKGKRGIGHFNPFEYHALYRKGPLGPEDGKPVIFSTYKCNISVIVRLEKVLATKMKSTLESTLFLLERKRMFRHKRRQAVSDLLLVYGNRITADEAMWIETGTGPYKCEVFNLRDLYARRRVLLNALADTDKDISAFKEAEKRKKSKMEYNRSQPGYEDHNAERIYAEK